MSQENVEIVRRALSARRSEFADLLDPSVRLDLSERVFNPDAACTTYRLEVQEAIDRGDRVLLLTHDFGRREGSEQEVKLIGAEVWTVRDGKTARWKVYADRADALKAVGLDG